MMRNVAKLAMLGALALAGPALAQVDGVYNGSFEEMGSPPSASGPRGWRSFNFARYRAIDDGLGPVLVRTGEHSIELASGDGATNDFGAFTSDVFDAVNLLFYNPAVTFPGGGDVTVSGWYAIPADQPLTGANSGLKLEFRRENSSVFAAFEALTINGHTNGKWVQQTLTVTEQQIQDILNEFPPGPVMVSILPLRFGSRTSTGTVFWDDIEFRQGTTPPACPCDWNEDTNLNSQDFFDFLTGFFAGNADFNDDGTTNSQDFFDFLTCFFSGCE